MIVLLDIICTYPYKPSAVSFCVFGVIYAVMLVM